MRARELITEAIVYRDTLKHNRDDWLNTVIAINPTKSEFWSANFRQSMSSIDKTTLSDTPSAAGVILKNGTVVVGIGHVLDHSTICELAGVNVTDEWMRIQIYDSKVYAEIWIPEDWATSDDSLEKKILAAEKLKGMSIDEIKQKISKITSRFVPGWEVVCLLWTEGDNLKTDEV